MVGIRISQPTGLVAVPDALSLINSLNKPLIMFWPATNWLEKKKKIGPMPNLVADPCTRALNIINKSYEGGQTTAQLHNLYFVNLLHKKMPKESKEYLPKDIFEDVHGQRGGAEHHEQALLHLAVLGRQFLYGGQREVRLDAWRCRGSREALERTPKTSKYVHIHKAKKRWKGTHTVQLLL